MARSTKIYVAFVAAEPQAAFTVKHELISWLEKHGHPLMWVQSMPDNPVQTYPTPIDGRGEDITSRPEIQAALHHRLNEEKHV